MRTVRDTTSPDSITLPIKRPTAYLEREQQHLNKLFPNLRHKHAPRCVVQDVPETCHELFHELWNRTNDDLLHNVAEIRSKDLPHGEDASCS